MKTRRFVFVLGSFILMPLLILWWWLSSEYSIRDAEERTLRSTSHKQIARAFESRMRNPWLTVRLAEEAFKNLSQLEDRPGAASASRVAGIGYFYLHDYTKAIKHYSTALNYYQSSGDSLNLARVYSNIGRLYSFTNPGKSLQYYYRALMLVEKNDDKGMLAGLYLNIATVYTGSSGYRKALYFFNKSENLFRSLNDTVHQIICLQNAASLYHKLGKVGESKRQLRIAIDRSKQTDLAQVIAGSQFKLALLHLEAGEIDKTKILLDSAWQLSVKLSTPDLQYDAHYLRYRLAESTDDLKAALENLKFIYKQDSAALMAKESADIGSVIRYYQAQNELQEKQLIITEQRYEAARSAWIIAATFAVLASVVGIFVILYLIILKRRRKADLRVRDQMNILEQKALQAMMNPHFVFNVMNAIQHFMNESDSRAANQILAGYGRLTRKHLEICLQTMIVLHEEIVYQELYLSLEKVRFSGLSYRIEVDEELDLDEISIPAMMIQPFVENAIWHGIMPHDGKGQLDLLFQREDDDLLVKIIDDGVGIDNATKNLKPSHISRGIALIRQRVDLWNKLNKRSISISQLQNGQSGTTAVIRIPID